MDHLKRITERVYRHGDPNETDEGWAEGGMYEPYAVPAGSRPVRCWWD
jgi:hypothetical protein